MCTVSPPRVQNIVVHFQLPREDLPLLLCMPAAADFSRSSRNFYVHHLKTLVTASSLESHLEKAEETKGKRRKKRRKKGVSFTIFPKGGSIIATGLRNETEIPQILEHFARECGAGARTPPIEWSHRTVNSTYVGKISHEKEDKPGLLYHALSTIGKRLEREDDKSISINFRSQFFPGILVRWNDLRGSVNVFDSGHYVLVGVKSRAEVDAIFRKLCALIAESLMTMKRQMSYVWTADS